MVRTSLSALIVEVWPSTRSRHGETSLLLTYRAARLLAACLLALLPGLLAVPLANAQGAGPVGATASPPRGVAAPSRPRAANGSVAAIKIDGNHRIESGTIQSYLLVQVGDSFDPDRLDRSLKVLYATGLFQDVRLDRQGDTLIVHVVENPIVNRVAFEGNHKLTDENLREGLQLRSRVVFTPAMAEADRQHILTAYGHRGYYDATVDAKIVRLPENRVDVIFQITDGSSTLISKIVFTGNKAFSESRLDEVINSRETRWWRFLSSSDQYEPERLAYDKELLRRFYLKNGYADFTVVNASGELSPDRKAFFLSFTVSEGERYRVGKVVMTTQLRNLDVDTLKNKLELVDGDWYDGDAVGRTADALEHAVHDLGYSFVEVKPQIDRDAEHHLINITYVIGEGPRVYVERIDIVGNTRTKDKVIRREFRTAEGDPYSPDAIQRTKTRLTDLGYFGAVDITPNPGSAPDKVILNSSITEKATGEISFGGGYSTDAGPLLDIGLSEKNIIGTGVNASINGILATKRTSVTLSVSDPYFLDRNLIAGFDVFLVRTNYLGAEPYDESRDGFATHIGYEFNEHLRQVWSYSFVDRDVYNIEAGASPYIVNEAGTTILSQVSQAITYDTRDSHMYPHKGYIVQLGTDLAGLGGDVSFFRTNVSSAYYIPLEKYFGNEDWVLKVSGGTGWMTLFPGSREEIIDRFFLGGDNLRGFETAGAGPHDASTGNPLGGRWIWTQSTELHYPLPVPPDLGLSGRVFVDVGGLQEASFKNPNACQISPGQSCVINASPAARVGAGVGVSWRTAFGLINIDLAPFVYKQQQDQTQIFRFGFGTRF